MNIMAFNYQLSHLHVYQHNQSYVGRWKLKCGQHSNIHGAAVKSLWTVSSKLGEISNMVKKQTTYTKNKISCSGLWFISKHCVTHVHVCHCPILLSSYNINFKCWECGVNWSTTNLSELSLTLSMCLEEATGWCNPRTLLSG